MKLVISHFFNEEYLLPWWLRHHRELFDHGILIDYHSTDRSMEICRELAPDWEVITSANEQFAALAVDFEVMQHEARFPDAWKLALNATEFLVGDRLDAVIERAEATDQIGVRIPGTAMVDDDPDSVPDPERPLVAQKVHGFWESEFPADRAKYTWFFPRARTRLLHRNAFGAYTPGRHDTMLPGVDVISDTELGIWWYGYSPWTPEFVGRKTQIQTRIDPGDRKAGFGRQHLGTVAEMEARRAQLLRYSRDLSMAPGEHDATASADQLLRARGEIAAELDRVSAEKRRAVRELEATRAELEQVQAERDRLRAELEEDRTAAGSRRPSASDAASALRRRLPGGH